MCLSAVGMRITQLCSTTMKKVEIKEQREHASMATVEPDSSEWQYTGMPSMTHMIEKHRNGCSVRGDDGDTEYKVEHAAQTSAQTKG